MRIVLADGISAKWKRLDRSLAQGGVNVISWCYGSPPEVLSYCRMVAPCVLVIHESFLTNIFPADFARAIDRGHSIKVLVEVDQFGCDKEKALVRMSCSGVIPAKCTSSNMEKAIKVLRDGELWITRCSAASLILGFLNEDSPKLTERECEILELIGEGLKNQEIAERLFISLDTVRWHIRSLNTKLGIHDREAAATQAKFLGGTHHVDHKQGFEIGDTMSESAAARRR